MFTRNLHVLCDHLHFASIEARTGVVSESSLLDATTFDVQVRSKGGFLVILLSLVYSSTNSRMIHLQPLPERRFYSIHVSYQYLVPQQ